MLDYLSCLMSPLMVVYKHHQRAKITPYVGDDFSEELGLHEEYMA